MATAKANAPLADLVKQSMYLVLILIMASNVRAPT
jgi:hypothetical protein